MTVNKDKIHFIATGGTIDKHYDPMTQQNELNAKSVVPDYLLDIIGIDILENFQEIESIDSRDMTDEHRENIFKQIESSPHQKIIILHGTDGMVETSQYVSSILSDTDKKIIFTGSIIPLDGFTKTDAPFNLGYAIGVVENINDGIYICMNGQTFTPDNVTKNIKKSFFEAKETL